MDGLSLQVLTYGIKAKFDERLVHILQHWKLASTMPVMSCDRRCLHV